MPRATAVPRVDSSIRLRDGRGLAYAEWGDPGGRPVVFLHGAPASRLFCPDEDATVAAGVRLITIDRPGYGLSDALTGRIVLDWPDDYVELADALDLSPCPVIGWSSGGRPALAQGYKAPDRVTSIGLVAAVGPLDLVPNGFTGLEPDEEVAFELLTSDRVAGLAAISEHSDWLQGDGWESMFTESWGEADDRVLADPATAEAMRILTREGARQGKAGYEADELEMLSPWGFDLGDIQQPVHIWSGESDPIVSPTHGAYFKATIRRSTLVTYAGEGHLLPMAHWAEMLAALH